MQEWLETYIGKTPAAFVSGAIPIIVVILVCLAVIKLVMKFVRKAIEKSKLEKGLHTFVEKTISIILYFNRILLILIVF